MLRRVLIVCFCLMVSGGLFADVILLQNGRKLTVQEYAVSGNSIQLTLSEKSEMTVPLEWVREIRATPKPVAKATSSPEGQFAFSKMIFDLSRKHDFDWKLVAAVMKAESNFRPRAISPKGALGLMQLMPETARLYQVSDPYDPEQNIDAGIRHLKMLMERYDGNLKLALAAYNSGEKAVQQYKGIPPFQETRLYVKRVMKLYQNF